MGIQIYHHTSRGSALLVSLIVLILITLLTTVFLEVIWSSSKNVQGIEASNASYYQAIGLVEEQLIDPAVSKKSPWEIKNRDDSYASTGRTLSVQTGSSVMPQSGFGNSPYDNNDNNYNIIALGEPVQIVIPDGINWANVQFEFRVPKVSSDSGTGVANTMSNSGIILWTLGYTGASLYASGETQIFIGADLNTSTNRFSSFSGITNTGSSISVSGFYTTTDYLGISGSKCNPHNCTLKLSMIRPVMTSTTGGASDGRSLPFLEYKINFDVSGLSSIRVPSQFMTLDASAYAYGFQRTRRTRIPQITTNTALDFAVLQ